MSNVMKMCAYQPLLFVHSLSLANLNLCS